jgi:ferredoxin
MICSTGVVGAGARQQHVDHSSAASLVSLALVGCIGVQEALQRICTCCMKCMLFCRTCGWRILRRSVDSAVFVQHFTVLCLHALTYCRAVQPGDRVTSTAVCPTDIYSPETTVMVPVSVSVQYQYQYQCIVCISSCIVLPSGRFVLFPACVWILVPFREVPIIMAWCFPASGNKAANAARSWLFNMLPLVMCV